MAQTCELHELPEETLLSLFRWLEPRDVLACGSTNWRLRGLALDGAYWRAACMAWYAERGWSTESQTARKEDIKEWWREYSTLTRQLETQACHPLRATKGHHYQILGFDEARNEVVWTDQRKVGSVSLDRPSDVKECPAALVPARANKARDVLYSDGAVLSLVEEDKLKVYDLVTGDVLKAFDQVGAMCCTSGHLALWRRPAAVLELYDRRQGWDAPPVWKASLGNRYTAEPTLFLDSSSASPHERAGDGGRVLVAQINNVWRVFGLQSGTDLATIKHCMTYTLSGPFILPPSMMGRDSDIPQAKAVALMTPDHVLCCHPAYIRVIWKASLQKGTAPKHVDVHWEQQSLVAPQVIKLEHGGTDDGHRYLLAVIAGRQIVCWELPTEWQETLELYQGRPLVHPQDSELRRLTGLYCDGDRLFLWSVLEAQRGTSLRFQLHEHEMAVFSLRGWALSQRMHLGTSPAAQVMDLPEGRAAILTRSLMWGRDWINITGWALTLFAPAQAKRNAPDTNQPVNAPTAE